MSRDCICELKKKMFFYYNFHRETMSTTMMALSYSQLIIIVPHLVIGVVAYLQTIFSLNRFQGLQKTTGPEAVSFGIFLVTGLVRWVNSLAAMTSSFAIQLTCGIIASMLSWSAFVILYNNKIELPSRQQMESLLFSLLSAALWETVTRLMMDAH